jgi:replication factor C subunit 1
MNKIIGQGTDKSNANKLFNWLNNWNKWNNSSTSKTVKKPWNDQDTGSCFKAALLSGPPGIGKTTSAQLVCKEAGYTFVELNASDSRSKKLLDKFLGESIENCSISSYFKNGSNHKTSDLLKDKHCIIMDEVDGMAGNEDRGGVAELIASIKSSRIPIICICNDRQHVKIRSLANHCFDLRFYKPRLEQVRGAMKSICFKEGIEISTEILDQIIIGCNYDIRQCLNNLSMWSSNNKTFQANKTTDDIEKVY